MKLTEIPKGDYCYRYNGKNGVHENGLPYMGIDECPHKTMKKIGGVNVYWCTYLNKGGLGCIESDKEWSKLVKYFGTEDGVFEMLPLDLLFDGCKHCGVNCDEEGEMYEEESSTNSNSIIL